MHEHSLLTINMLEAGGHVNPRDAQTTCPRRLGKVERQIAPMKKRPEGRFPFCLASPAIIREG